MIQLNKTQLVLSFICLAGLRIVIGLHFFDQGHQKIQGGGFDASGFLKAAKGPFAEQFHAMVPDYDGKVRLCYDPLKEGNNKIDPSRTLKIWETYKDYVVDQLVEEEKRLVDLRQRMRIKLEKLDSKSDEYVVFNDQYRSAEETILAIRDTRKTGAANRIFTAYSDTLQDFLTVNEEEINYYFMGESRLEGFERDYEIADVDGTLSEFDEDNVRTRKMKKVADNVNLLRQQVETISSDRKKVLAGWLAEIDGFWAGFRSELLSIVELSDAKRTELTLQTPSDSTMMTFMNKAIPCFDMTIGVLLIAGLFTRFAAMGAGLFLVSVLMTQAAILGEGSTPLGILYLIETCAAFVLAATCAGRFAGLDYFIHAIARKIFPSKNEDSIG